MFSYRFMRMSMSDNLKGAKSISPDEVVTTISNPTGVTETLRVVPKSMETEMHMFGLMYAPTDDLTLMAMVPVLNKEMEHITYSGMMGVTVRGGFGTSSAGFGDIKLSGLIKLYESAMGNIHLNAGVSLPTGSITENDSVLPPNLMMDSMQLRMPYAMQLGSGTYDLLPGITYFSNVGRWSWGGQYMATIRVGENSENYTLGDQQQVSAWGGYRFMPGLSASVRLSFKDEDSVEGADDLISAPVQTANPDYYGGRFIDGVLGLNYVVQSGRLRGYRFGLEYTMPISQKVNGVQMAMDSMLTLGYQISF
ncbi:hypothetical protein Maes01_00250 [Microbulbifer aestuariivivens]|uniref:Transporter n=2 Tax=Microbulbifer aestuariivivens TaxID=1908308 RepID=A0ABP9WMQ6_9GAMM